LLTSYCRKNILRFDDIFRFGDVIITIQYEGNTEIDQLIEKIVFKFTLQLRFLMQYFDSNLPKPNQDYC